MVLGGSTIGDVGSIPAQRFIHVRGDHAGGSSTEEDRFDSDKEKRVRILPPLFKHGRVAKMNIEELRTKYPQFLTDVPCGVSCGDGWVDILDRLFTDLDAMNIEIRVGQIKEKFGLLRVYAYGGKENSRQIQDRINRAESESSLVCEDCGEPGTRRSIDWIRTLCDRCEQVMQCRSRSR